LNDSNVLILPPQLVDFALIEFLNHATGKKVVTGFSSGWKYRNCFDKIFCLSDHADFEQLMSYVEQVQPKNVFTMHGFAQEFANYLGRRLKIPAQPLTEYKQKNLIEFTD
jgi:Cft2 family RNA processing exonuclease